MWKPQELSDLQKYYCYKTISTNVFYMMVGDYLVRRKPFSVVRMGDGERILLDICKAGGKITDRFDEKWIARLGLLGITNKELQFRIDSAAYNCTMFAPSVTGIVNDHFNLYDLVEMHIYADNFFCNAWTTDMQIDLYKEAGHVLIIHGNPNTANALQSRAEKFLGVKVSFIQMNNWDESERVVKQARADGAPLVIFSAGPAGKFIGPEIAKDNKVVLDIGNAMDRWTLLPLYEAEKHKLAESH